MTTNVREESNDSGQDQRWRQRIEAALSSLKEATRQSMAHQEPGAETGDRNQRRCA